MLADWRASRYAVDSWLSRPTDPAALSSLSSPGRIQEKHQRKDNSFRFRCIRALRVEDTLAAQNRFDEQLSTEDLLTSWFTLTIITSSRIGGAHGHLLYMLQSVACLCLELSRLYASVGQNHSVIQTHSKKMDVNIRPPMEYHYQMRVG